MLALWGDSLTFQVAPYLSALAGFQAINGGVGGETSTQIKARFMAAPGLHGYPTIIWAGRNNFWERAIVKADIAEMVAALQTSRYVVVGILNGNSAWETPGGSGYDAINTLNAELALQYGDKFCNIRPYMVEQYDPANPQDVIDHGKDVTPGSLRSDNLHLNAAGNAKAAPFIFEALYPAQQISVGANGMNASRIYAALGRKLGLNREATRAEAQAHLATYLSAMVSEQEHAARVASLPMPPPCDVTH
jgi:lysophospholipase L1-like esterase